MRQRVLEDHVIEEERAAADETLHEDRVRHIASISSQRDETDRDLSDERAQGTSAIAELKGVEKTLEDQNIEIQAANRVKSEFVADMSHELRGPLHAIIGFSEVLKDGLVGAMTDQQHRFVGDILTSSTHVLAVVNDVLDLSKVEAGRMVLETAVERGETDNMRTPEVYAALTELNAHASDTLLFDQFRKGLDLWMSAYVKGWSTQGLTREDARWPSAEVGPGRHPLMDRPSSPAAHEIHRASFHHTP